MQQRYQQRSVVFSGVVAALNAERAAVLPYWNLAQSVSSAWRSRGVATRVNASTASVPESR